MAAKPKDISILAELERYAFKYQWAGPNDIAVCCPFHEDTKPSCVISVAKKAFICHAANCSKKGDFVDLLCGKVKQPRSVVLEDLATRYDLDDIKIVEPAVVERWHSCIWKAGPLLQALYNRAITDDIIKERKLGEDNGRITIPVANEAGDWVNVRKYLPGAPGSEKMRNLRGRGQARWYPIDQLKYGTILLVGGEMKALAAAMQLNPHGIGALSYTSEKRIPTDFLKQLTSKSVYVCMDIDEAGRKAALSNLMALKPIASELYDVVLPLDSAKFPKGDINDYIKNGGDLWQLLQSLNPWIPPELGMDGLGEPSDLHLAEAINAKYAGKRVRVKALCVAMDIAPYSIPATVKVSCDRSQKCCSLCPIWQHENETFNIPPEHPSILAAVGGDAIRLQESIGTAIGIPKMCRVWNFETEKFYNAEDVRISPCLEITSRVADQKTLPAICIGKGLEMNEPYQFVGRMLPHPKTQQSTLLISNYEQTQDALSTYEPTDEDIKELKSFCPTEWTETAIQHQLDKLYGDIERHVTRIRCRRDMHLAIDLTWHSPLILHMGKRDCKGWLETLIVGDSEQGKTETAMGFLKYYGLGEKLECKNATAAGLLGGLQQLGNGRWFASWGLLPQHDKRLVFLEELKGASTETIGKLTDMRSSGIAEMTKIEKRRAHARTRILAVSNPRSDGRTINSYSYGVETIKELIGGLEDIRRFDLFYILSAADVTPQQITAPWPENGHQIYSPELSRSLVLWTWTRSSEQCSIDDDVWQLCIEEANKLSSEFSDTIPIIGGGAARYKIARLAASLAARTFSTSEDGLSLVVRPCHVHFIVNFLRRIYSTPTFGYVEYTKASKASTEIVDADAIKKFLAALPFPYEVVKALLQLEKIEVVDLQDWCGWEREQAAQAVSLFVRKHAFRRDGRYYRKTGAFIDLLRSILASKDMPDRPDFIKEPEF